MNTIRLLISVFLFALSMNGWCDEFVVDGIKYSTNEDNISVSVIPNSYTGDIVIPSSVTYNEKSYSVTGIGKYAFMYTFGLTSVTIPGSVTSIGDLAFTFWPDVISLIVDKENKVFDSRDNCNAIIESQSNTLIAGCMNTVIPNSVTSIGVGAFWDCEYLTSIIIPNSVTSIGQSAFSSCESLTSITIPSSVTSIGWNAFSACTNLASIVVDKENKVYDSRDNCNAIIDSQNDTLVIGCKNTVIPNNVTGIKTHAFCSCFGLTSITIPGNVKNIGWSAFESCYDLKSVTMQEGVTSIETGAFVYCRSLASVVIPSSVTSMGESVFHDCSALSTIVCNIEKPLTVDSSAFYRVDKSNCVLYVPAGCVDAYKAADVWNEFENIREIDPTAVEMVSNDAITPDAIYNLRGQKVSAGYRGIVIRNGKKVLGK